jgi:hypothetical protein
VRSRPAASTSGLEFYCSAAGTMIHKAGAGPALIPHKKLNADNLRDAIQYALSHGAKVAAAKMAEGIKAEVSSRFTHFGMIGSIRAGFRMGYIVGWSLFTSICHC